MKGYFRNWNIMRVIRLVLGLIVVGQGIYSSDWTFIVLGAFVTLLPILNLGCCGTAGCNTRINTKSDTKLEEVVYEEVR